MFQVRIQKSSHLRVHSERDKSCSYLIIISVLFDEIVKYSGKSPSTISRHLRGLCADEIIAVHHGGYNIYRIIDRKLANQMLHKYKESFDSYLDLHMKKNFVILAVAAAGRQ